MSGFETIPPEARKSQRHVEANRHFDPAQARQRGGAAPPEARTDGAAASFPVLKVDEEIWSGDRLTFRVRALGQAAAGTVDVAEDHVRLEVTLPWLLQKFAQVAQATIRARGNLLLEKK